MNLVKIKHIIVFLVALSLGACDSEYTQLVQSELGNGRYYDSLVFNIKFGDTKKEFYEKCWQLNRAGLVIQGPDNNYVQHIFGPDTLPGSIRMLFYGAFDGKNKMVGLNIKFSFIGWSPWNDDFQSENLLATLKDSLEQWYPGNEFMKLEFDTEPSEIWVKVDGNRQVAMHSGSDQYVIVKVTDLRERYKNGF